MLAMREISRFSRGLSLQDNICRTNADLNTVSISGNETPRSKLRGISQRIFPTITLQAAGLFTLRENKQCHQTHNN
jgi:hypothetical protein